MTGQKRSSRPTSYFKNAARILTIFVLWVLLAYLSLLLFAMGRLLFVPDNQGFQHSLNGGTILGFAIVGWVIKFLWLRSSAPWNARNAEVRRRREGTGQLPTEASIHEGEVVT